MLIGRHRRVSQVLRLLYTVERTAVCCSRCAIIMHLLQVVLGHGQRIDRLVRLMFLYYLIGIGLRSIASVRSTCTWLKERLCGVRHPALLGLRSAHYTYMHLQPNQRLSPWHTYEKLVWVNSREKRVRVPCRLAARYYSREFLASNRACSISCRFLVWVFGASFSYEFLVRLSWALVC